MLNRLQLLQELERISDQLFIDMSDTCLQMRSLWTQLSNDPTFLYQVYQAYPTWQLPLWQGSLNDVFPVNPIDLYQVIGIDGSQIYPDRHHPISCFLINTGVIHIRYAPTGSTVAFSSEPSIFQGFTYDDGTYECSRAVVNCLRQEVEFQKGVLLGKQSYTDPHLTLLDGSLIFWHLQSGDMRMFDRFFPSYVRSLQELCEQKTPVIGYISSPKGKDLVNLIRFSLEQKGVVLPKQQNGTGADIDRMIDTALIAAFLPPFHRSTLFQYRSSLSDQYPESCRPFFFYLHTSSEIARIEIPAWVARNEQLMEEVCSIIVDQCNKGNGYPICLAEAHEQAVVKGPDRDFFYLALDQLAIKHGHTAQISTKSMRKLRMSV